MRDLMGQLCCFQFVPPSTRHPEGWFCLDERFGGLTYDQRCSIRRILADHRPEDIDWSAALWKPLVVRLEEWLERHGFQSWQLCQKALGKRAAVLNPGDIRPGMSTWRQPQDRYPYLFK